MSISKLLITSLFFLVLYGNLLSGTIYGFVRIKESGEPVIGANIWIKGTHIGTTTNVKGYYVLPSLPPGNYQICLRFIGYKMQNIQKQIGAADDISVDFFLELDPIVLEAVVIEGEKEKGVNEIRPSRIVVQIPQIRRMAQVAEPDLFRAIQMLPGVATLSDFSAGLYVRGGSADQNLIMLDHIDVYNPNHMFGFFSTFNTDAIKSVELLKGGFPAKFGGRLSSVLNVVNKEGDRNKFHGTTRISLLSASTTLEGPWKKGSWMISGRRTYLDLVGKIVDFDLPYYFYDGHFRFNYDIDKKNQASISFYTGNDNLNLSQDESSKIRLDWGNKTFSAQWTHLFSSRLFAHFVIAGSRFKSDTKVEFDNIAFGLYNEITDLCFKGMMVYSPTTNHTVDFGFENKILEFDLNYNVVGFKYLNPYSGKYYAVYLQDNIRLGALITLQAGFRLNHYSAGKYTRLVPRLSIKRVLTDNSYFTLSYGRYSQYLNMVQQEGISFADMWFPVDESFKPGGADHYILGYSYDNQETISVNVEGYYKNYSNIAEYKIYRGADEDFSNMNAAQNFYSGNGYAYGGDIFLRNNLWGFEGWLGYSLNWTRKQIADYNFGKTYFPTYDRRHTITAIQDYKLGKKWRLNLAFKYGSGQPYTEATARYAVLNPNGTVYYLPLDGEKNSHRLPSYHRLDIGVFYNTRLFKLKTEFYLQVVNIYNHKNVWYRRWQTFENPAKIKDYNMIPLLPTAGFSITF